jgi:hypothetical protein
MKRCRSRLEIGGKHKTCIYMNLDVYELAEELSDMIRYDFDKWNNNQ